MHEIPYGPNQTNALPIPPRYRRGHPALLRSSLPSPTAQSLDTQANSHSPDKILLRPSWHIADHSDEILHRPNGLERDLIPLISQQPRSSLFFFLLFLSPLFITFFPTIFRYIDRCRSLFVIFLVIYYLCRFE